MSMKKSLQFALFVIAAVAVVAEPPAAAYGPPSFASGFRPAGHGTAGYQGGYQAGYQGGFQGGYHGFQGGYQNGYQGGYQGGYRNKYQGGYDDGAPTPFNFQYEVKDPQSGNDYGHQASSDGRNVQGEYQVLLPDGRRQIVKYTADDNGYNADVRYEGEARQYQGGFRGYQNAGYTGHAGYNAQAGYTGHAGYNAQAAYSGHAGYTGHGGYLSQGAFAGQKGGYSGYGAQKAVFGGYAR